MHVALDNDDVEYVIETIRAFTDDKGALVYPEYSVKELGFLSDPSFHNSPIDIRGCDADILQHQLRMMLIFALRKRKSLNWLSNHWPLPLVI